MAFLFPAIMINLEISEEEAMQESSTDGQPVVKP